jgi:hypothetical protein
MTRKIASLAGVERIARLRSDLEMRRFAAFRAHVDAARDRASQIAQEIEALYRPDVPFSVVEARLVNALAGERSRALLAAERELERMLPGYENARRAAIREFGRAEAVMSLRVELVARVGLDRMRRENGG